jgi:hypothetical protein
MLNLCYGAEIVSSLGNDVPVTSDPALAALWLMTEALGPYRHQLQRSMDSL